MYCIRHARTREAKRALARTRLGRFHFGKGGSKSRSGWTSMGRTYRPSGTRGGLYSFLSDQLTCIKVEAGLRQGREPEHGRTSSVSRRSHIAFVDR